jgi:FkbM family methyltransferase
MFKIFLYKIFLKIYYFFYSNFGIKLKGVGYFSEFIKEPFIFKFKNTYFYFNPKASRSYNLIISDIPNEKSTHIFLEKLLKNINSGIQFVNVGASIGEFLIVYSKYKNVKYAIGFEPIDECYKSLIISKLINNLENLEIYNVLIGDKDEIVEFFYKPKSPTGSSIKLRENAISLKKQMHKIDTLFERGIIKEEITVMLIDVEGAEYEVILGAKNFINKVKPLIIMEYNQISKKFYKITDILSILGENYKVFRLNKFGKLDKELDNTYNVVFINEALNFPI